MECMKTQLHTKPVTPEDRLDVKNSYLEWILKKDLFSPLQRWGETASLAPAPQS